MKPSPTKTIFRRFRDGGDVIALFPEIPADHHIGNCESYQHVGQHGAANVYLSDVTRPASVDEPDVASLKRELEAIGYVVQVVKRVTQSMNTARRNELARIEA